MKRYVLLGAGFSRNWGGWLANEVFEYLIGCSQVLSNQHVRKLLWKHQGTNGFEGALAELQEEAGRSGNVADVVALMDALADMFDRMNKALIANAYPPGSDTEFLKPVRLLLNRCDAIFTLNQDVLLESIYMDETTFNINLLDGTPGRGRWHGVEFPGMQRELHLDHKPGRRALSPYSQTGNFRVSKGNQPIYKLHGSSTWKTTDSSPMMILGGAKENALRLSPVLWEYAKEFRRLLLEPGARLMVIGYGFRDEHINATIAAGVEAGLEIFINAPDGAELARRLNPTRANNKMPVPTSLELLFEQAVIGASRRNLREVFAGDEVEWEKFDRFFGSDL